MSREDLDSDEDHELLYEELKIYKKIPELRDAAWEEIQRQRKTWAKEAAALAFLDSFVEFLVKLDTDPLYATNRQRITVDIIITMAKQYWLLANEARKKK